MLDHPSIRDRRLLFITGKGGIGKSTIAAVVGMASARSGQDTLLVESNQREQIAPLFAKVAPTHEEIQLAPNLSTINLTARGNFREYVSKYLGQKALYETVFSNRVVRSFINTIPGFGEVMLLGRLFYSCNLAERRPDRVIFDGYASGHFLKLMTTPQALIDSGLGGPLVRETERVKAFLEQKSHCGIVYVMTPESLVINESLDFLPRLITDSPVNVAALVVNRRMPVLESAIDDALLSQFVENRRRQETSAIDRLKKGVEQLSERYNIPLPILELPDLGFIEEPLSEDLVSRLA